MFKYWSCVHNDHNTTEAVRKILRKMSTMELVLKNKKPTISYTKETLSKFFWNYPFKFSEIANNASVKLLLKEIPYQLQSHLRVAISCVFQNVQEEIYDGVCFNIFRTILKLYQLYTLIIPWTFSKFLEEPVLSLDFHYFDYRGWSRNRSRDTNN